MNELLELSKKHGIMTPYTAFLADDSVALDATAENARRAAGAFKTLASQTSNMSGFAQRSMKQSYRGAQTLAAEDSVSDDLEMAAAPQSASNQAFAVGSARSARTGARAMSFGRQSVASAPVDLPQTTAASASVSQPRDTVRTIGGKTFYFKEGRWVDAALDKESQIGNEPIVVEQFSDEYFELVGRLGREFSQYLAFEEPSTFLFDGRIYRVEPSKNAR